MKIVLDTEPKLINGHAFPGSSLAVEPLVGTLKITTAGSVTAGAHTGYKFHSREKPRIRLKCDFWATEPYFKAALELCEKPQWLRSHGLVDDFIVTLEGFMLADSYGRSRAFTGAGTTSFLDTARPRRPALTQYIPLLLAKIEVQLKEKIACGGIFSLDLVENFNAPDLTCPVVPSP